MRKIPAPDGQNRTSHTARRSSPIAPYSAMDAAITSRILTEMSSMDQATLTHERDEMWEAYRSITAGMTNEEKTAALLAPRIPR